LRGWRVFFLLVMFYEVLGSLATVLDLEGHASMFFRGSEYAAGPAASLYAHLAWVMLIILGFGYGLVAYDPRRTRGLLWIGILVRLSFVVGRLQDWMGGLVRPIVPAVGLGDVVLDVLTLVFLARTRRLGWI
jgi:hypothetical protein